jgi:hypothetical protein
VVVRAACCGVSFVVAEPAGFTHGDDANHVVKPPEIEAAHETT